MHFSFHGTGSLLGFKQLLRYLIPQEVYEVSLQSFWGCGISSSFMQSLAEYQIFIFA